MFFDYVVLEGDDVFGGVGVGDVFLVWVCVLFLLDLFCVFWGVDDRYR